MSLADLPLEIIGEIAGESGPVYHALVLAYPRFARSLTLGDRLDFAEKFGYDCRVERFCKVFEISWTRHGMQHRTDGPAVEYASGSKMWYINGKRHRTDGPATTWSNGEMSWWIDDKRHRTDGPAVMYATGRVEWRIDGVETPDGELLVEMSA